LNSTQAILKWLNSTNFEDIPPDVRKMAMWALYDGIGCNLACSMLPVAHRMADFVEVVGGRPDCSMIGFPERTSAVNAAVLNGTLGHADEVDSVGGDMGAHIMAATMGAALAAGQLAKASGQEIVRAVVLGSELSHRVHLVGTKLERRVERTYGLIDAGNTMGAVASAGIALRLSAEQMDKALSLGATLASGITPFARENEHMVKSFVRGGLGAKHGVTAALMARVGYDSPGNIFDGSHGFFDSKLGVEPGPEFVAGLGEEYDIVNLEFKRRCGGGPTQAPSQALLDMMGEYSISADDIEEVRAEVEPAGYHTITAVHAPSIYGKTVMAIAAVYGGRGFKETHQEVCYKSSQVASLEDRITILPKQDWDEHDHFRAVVTVTTRDGRTFRKEADYRHMTEADLDAKFADLVGLRAGEAKAKELAQAVKRLDRMDNIADLMVQLEMPAVSIEQV